MDFGSGEAPARRRDLQGRLPILLWGDIVEGETPVLRRALAGDPAHECMYAWVYLTDFLAHTSLLEQLGGGTLSLESLGDLDGPAWESTARAEIDPHFQVSAESYHLITALACMTADWRETPHIVELGSTFGTAVTKWAVVGHVARKDRPMTYTGIDNSPLMARAAKVLHGEELAVIDDVKALPPGSSSVLLSRFVASYVFPHATALLDWTVDNFEAFAIEDPFTVDGSDWNGQNHGQDETFFSLPLLVDGLIDAGYFVAMISAYSDWPAGTTRCHVVKLVGLRDERSWGAFSHEFDRLSGQSITRVRGGQALLDRLNSTVDEADWTRIKAAKASSPVWGPTAADYRHGTVREARRVERSLGPWRNYHLGGPAAVAAIAQALGVTARSR